MSEAADFETELPEGKPFRYIPETSIGKILFGVYMIAFVAVALSVSGFVFSDPVMVGPMVASALWMYLWFAVMNVVLIGTYVYLFKPWAESASRLVEAEEEEWKQAQREQQKPDEVIFEGGEN